MPTLQHFSSLICVRRNHLFSAPLPSCGSTDPLFTPTPIFLGKLMFRQPETTSFIRTNLHLALSWVFPRTDSFLHTLQILKEFSWQERRAGDDGHVAGERRKKKDSEPKGGAQGLPECYVAGSTKHRDPYMTKCHWTLRILPHLIRKPRVIAVNLTTVFLLVRAGADTTVSLDLNILK